MEMTTSRLSPGLRRACVDLERYVREMAEGSGNEKKRPKLAHNTRHTHQQYPTLEDPLVPWLKVAMGALIVVAVGVGMFVIQQISGLHM